MLNITGICWTSALFLSGSEGTSKSHLVKVLCKTISKTLLCHCKNSEKPRVLVFGSTRISAANISGTTIYSGLEIKHGKKLFSLNDKSRAALRNRLSEVKFLIINELSTVLNELWTVSYSRLGEVFMMIPEKTFACLSTMTVADFL